MLEEMGTLLKLAERVCTTFFKTEFACANQTFGTMPVIFRNAFDRRIKAIPMITGITTVTKQDVGRVIFGPACLASLLIG